VVECLSLTPYYHTQEKERERQREKRRKKEERRGEEKGERKGSPVALALPKTHPRI
jgi:hypothetical protein